MHIFERFCWTPGSLENETNILSLDFGPFVKLLLFSVKLTSWYHTPRSGVLSVVVADVVGQLRTELSVIDGEMSWVMVVMIAMMKKVMMMSLMIMMIMVMVMVTVVVLLMKKICLGSVQFTIGPTVFWSLHSPSCTVLS